MSRHALLAFCGFVSAATKPPLFCGDTLIGECFGT